MGTGIDPDGNPGTDPGNDGDATLPSGYPLHEFQIERVLGEGGFGIVYLARDLQLHRTVALKEYMPSSLAVRQPGNLVGVRSRRHRETFDLGLRSFVNEARLLASFDHPSLVKVYRFWEQNGTAYMVMPFYEGPTLKDWLKAQPQPPAEAWLKRLLSPLLDALALIHADHCYHRDIAPDNILLLGAEQRPLLLDFGAARRVIGDATQALTVILKPGYAPIEQYAEVPSMRQGPWTDIYALCAVLYMAITGRAPMAAVGRLMNDDLVRLATSAQGHYSPAFLAAIDAGLSVRPEHRPQDIAALRTRLFADAPAADDGVNPVTVMQPVDNEATVVAFPAPLNRGGATQALASAEFEVSRPAVTERPIPVGTALAQPPEAPPQPAARARRSSASLVLGGLIGVAVAGGAVWYLTRGGTTPAVVAAVPAAPPSVTPLPAAAVAPARAPFNVIAALEDIVRHGDPLISVNTLADKERIMIGTDRMQFRVKASEAGYLYVLFAGTGEANLQLLFPNSRDQNNRVAADTTVILPREGWKITASGPPGVNHIVTMVSRQPRDFSAAGLKQGETMPEFELAEARRVWSATPATHAAFAGDPRCAAAADCDTRYGATLIRIEEVAASTMTPGESTVPSAAAATKPVVAAVRPSSQAGKEVGTPPPARGKTVPLPSSVSARCAALLERLELGETLSNQSQLFLRQECPK